MKTNIHPKWYKNTSVVCACGNKFSIGSTLEKIEVEVCSNCHPYFTGQMKYVDTAGRVEFFNKKRKKAKGKVLSKAERRKLKAEKRAQEEESAPTTLHDLRDSKEAKKIKSSSSKGKKKK